MLGSPQGADPFLFLRWVDQMEKGPPKRLPYSRKGWTLRQDHPFHLNHLVNADGLLNFFFFKVRPIIFARLFTVDHGATSTDAHRAEVLPSVEEKQAKQSLEPHEFSHQLPSLPDQPGNAEQDGVSLKTRLPVEQLRVRLFDIPLDFKEFGPDCYPQSQR